MNNFCRYAIYYTPPAGLFAEFGASWLGWNPETGKAVIQSGLIGLDQAELTKEPQKYGFHATLKAPFRLNDTANLNDLSGAVDLLARDLKPPPLTELELSLIGGFFALRPAQDTVQMRAFATQVVMQLDPLRATLNEVEISRRNPGRLSPKQRSYLDRWGYPYVLDEFCFHMTLSGHLSERDMPYIQHALEARLKNIPMPDQIDALSLMGEASDGRFYMIARYPLG